MLGLGLRTISQVQQILRNIYTSAVARWSTNESKLRLRRDNDDFEKEFDPLAGRILDVDSITNFYKWNLLNGTEYRDYLYDYPLGTDTDDNGVSDGWTVSDEGTIEYNTTVENNTQLVNVTGGADATKRVILIFDDVDYTVGEDIAVSVDVSGDDTLQLKVVVIFYNNETFAGLSDGVFQTVPSDSFETITNITTPPTGNNARIGIYVKQTNNNDTGTLTFKNARVVKNNFIENIGLLTEDDNSSGVANYWNYDLNGFDGTVAKTVSSNGQKLEVTVGGTNNNNPFISDSFNALTGESYVLTCDARVTGDVTALVILQQTGGGDNQLSTTSTDWVTLILDPFVMTADTTIEPKLRLDPNGVGNTGSVEFRNATLKQTNDSVYCTKIFDKTGNENHATQTTLSTQPRLVNAGFLETNSDGIYTLNYDGTDKMVSTTGSLEELTIYYSFEPSLLPSEISGALARLIRTTDDNISCFYEKSSTAFKWKFTTTEGSTPVNVIDEANLLKNQSFTMASVYDKDKIYTYVNHTLLSTQDRDDTNPIFTDAWEIGGDTSLPLKYQDVSIFNKALTQSQIKLLNNSLNKPSDYFIMEVDTTETGSASDTFVLPLNNSYTYDFGIDWGDGNTELITNNSDLTHVYSTGGTYTIKIIGTFPAIYFNNGGDKAKLTDVSNWGNIEWQSMGSAFYGCSNVSFTATDVPNFTNVTDMSYMFYGCTNFNQDVSNFNTSNVTDMSFMFQGCSSFNQDLSNFNTSNVTTMYAMFRDCSSFNQDLSSFNTSNITSMSYMFLGCTNFNKDISNFNTSNVTNMSYMFYGCTNFNKDISNFNTSNVTNMYAMFYGCSSFDQDISSFNTSNVTNMSYMFYGCTNFNQDLSIFNTSNVTNMSNMFRGCTNFNQDISNFNTSNVTTMAYMFFNCSSFNQDISSFNIEKVTNMSNMLVSTAFDNTNYDLLLVSWEAQIEKPNVVFSAGTAQYSTGAPTTARTALVASGWNITDGGQL